MRKVIISLTLLLSTSFMNADNVFFSEFKTINGLIPFNYVSNSDYEPAVDKGIECQMQEIQAIVDQKEEPSFENTIVALERSGAMLNRVLGVMYPMLSANADEELMKISERVSPKLSEHESNITLNEGLWKRVKYVYDNCDKSKLSTEDKMLLEKTYIGLVSSGASREGADRDRVRQLSANISQPSL